MAQWRAARAGNPQETIRRTRRHRTEPLRMEAKRPSGLVAASESVRKVALADRTRRRLGKRGGWAGDKRPAGQRARGRISQSCRKDTGRGYRSQGTLAANARSLARIPASPARRPQRPTQPIAASTLGAGSRAPGRGRPEARRKGTRKRWRRGRADGEKRKPGGEKKRNEKPAWFTHVSVRCTTKQRRNILPAAS